MSFPPAVIDSLQTSYRYTEREARFLYLVATHSGHFLGRQFLQFSGATRGGVLQDFIERATEHRHIRDAVYAESGAKRYHLYAKPLYAALGKVNSSHRRTREIGKIVTKLLTLEFVLHHLDADYLEEEPDKVCYFYDELGIDKAYLPLRVYKPGNSTTAPTIRYFVDKFPIFVDREGLLTFAYIDDPLLSTDAFRTHLFHYRPLFQRLERSFRVCFVSSVPGKFPQAESAFRHVLSSEKGPSLHSEILEYFDLRRRWEAQDLAGFTPQLLRRRVELEKKYASGPFEKRYEDWQKSLDAPSAGAADSTCSRADFATFEVRA
jgi:hypothetical protein